MNYDSLSKKELIVLYEQLSREKEQEKYLGEKLHFAAIERTKAVIDCHAAYGRIVNNSSLAYSDKLLHIITELAHFFEFKGASGVRLKVYDIELSTPSFLAQDIVFSCPITLADSPEIGSIELSVVHRDNAELTELEDIDKSLVLEISTRLGGFALRYESDKQLKSQLKKYSSLIESINEVVYEYDENGILTFISSAVKEQFGFRDSELIGQSFGVFLNVDFVMRDSKLRQLKEFKYMRTEYKILTKSAEERWVRLSTTARFEDGLFIGGTGVLTDITKIKQTESELGRTERLYRSILHSSPDTIFVTDLNAGVLLFSGQAAAMFRTADDFDFKGHSLLDFLSLEERENFVRIIGLRLQGRNVEEQLTFCARRPNGELFDVDLKWDIIKNQVGRPENLIFILRDITESNVMMKKLTAAEEKYRNLVESLNEIIYEIDEKGTVQYVSPAIRTMGYEPGEMIGKSFLDFTGKHQDALYHNLLRLKWGEVAQNEYDMLSKDGQLHWLRFSTKAKFDDQGCFKGGMGTLIDVTESRRMEEELHKTEVLYSTMLNVLPDAIALCKIDGTVEYASPIICKMLRYPEGTSFQNTLIFDYIVESDKQRAIYNSFMRIAGDDIGMQEYKVLRNDGTEFDCEVNSAIIYNNDGGATQIILTMRDVSLRKKMEDDLRKSEEKYRLITEKISDVVWLMDLEGRSTFVSKSIENFTGFTPSEYMNQSIRSRFTPESVLLAEEAFADEIQRALEYGFNLSDTVTLELDYLCKDGTIKTGELLISALVDENSKLIGLQGVTRDVTLRKNTEKAMKDSEERYRNIFESVQDAYYEASIDGILLDISPSICRITQGRFKREDLVGKSFVNFYLDPLSRSKLQNELYTKGEVVDYEIELFSGEMVVPVAVTSSVLVNDDGIPTRIIGSIRDVSERRKSEQKLRESQALYQSVIMASPDDITIADLKGEILFVSPAGVEMFGYENCAQMEGMSILNFIAEVDRDRAYKAMTLMFEGIYERPGKYRGLRKDGSLFPMEVNGEFIRNTNGEPLRLIFIVRDMTERYHTDKALRLTEEKYRSLIDSADASIVMTDANGQYLFVNSIAAKPFLKYPDEIIGTNMADYFSAKDAESMLQNIRKVIDTCEGQVLETEIDVAGQMQCFRASLQPVRNEQGGAYAVLIHSTNITDIVLANKKLMESEQRYKTFFEGNKSTILLLDPLTGDIKDANPAACEYYGWSKEELCALKISQINTLPPNEVIVQLELTKQGQRKMHNFKHRLKDGSLRNVEVYAGPMVFGDQTLVYSIIHDVTERTQFEEKLQESEARFRMIFENVYDGICIFEESDEPEKRKLVDCNDQYAKMAGRSRTDLLSIGYTYSLTQTIDEDSNLLRIIGLHDKEPYHGAFKWIRPDGVDNYIQYIARPIDWEGKTYSIGIDRDMTESKYKENQLRKLSLVIEQSPISIIITDLEGRIEYANPEACKTSGYSLTELIGKNPRIFKSGEISTDTYADLWTKISHGQQWHGMFHNRNKEGRCYWESSMIAPILDEKNEIVSYVAIKEDVTEKIQADEELKKFRTISERANYGNVITSVDGEVLYLNDAFADMHGADRGNFVGKHFTIFHNEQQIPQVMLLFNKMADSGDFTAEQVWHTGLDGHVFPTLMSGTVIRNDRNVPIFYAISAIEISKMIESELALRESESNLNFAQEIAKLGSWTVDFEKHKTVWSENTYRILGLEPYADINMEEYFYSHVHPDDLKLVDFKNDLVRFTNSINTVQIRFIMPDESIKWLQGDVITIMRANEVIGLKGTFLDLTNIKKAEQALRNSEMNLNYAQQVANMGSWKLDLRSNNVEWSENEFILLGVDPTETTDLRKYFRENLHEEDRDLQEKVWNYIATYKVATSDEFRFIMPDKSIKWIQGDVSPILENGEIVALIGTHIDVTEKKLSENALVESEARLNYAQEISKMCSWEFDAISRKMVVSQNFYKIHHIDQSIKGANLLQLIQERIHVADRALGDKLLATGFPEGKTQTIEVRMMISAEDFVWIRGFVIPEYKEGKLFKIKGVNVDVTEQRLKDDQIMKLTQAVEQSPVAVLITDVHGNIEYVNPAFEEITGYTSEDVIGHNTRMLKSGKNNLKVYENLWKTILSGGIWESEWINKKRNNELYWEHISISPVFDASNEIVNFLAIKQDISSRKMIEQEILELNSTLEQKINERTNELENTNYSLLAEIHEREKFEKALRDSEYKYRSVVENIQEVIFQTDSDGLWLFLNKSWEYITGFTVEESMGQLFLNYVHPEDRQRNLDLFSVLIKREKDHCRHEIRYLTKDGGFRWIEVYARLGIDENNKTVGTYGSLRDVTESKLAKELLEWNKSLLEMMSNSSPLGFLVVDNRTDDILYFNSRFCEIWGIQNIEEQMKQGLYKNSDIIPYCMPLLVDVSAFVESCKPLQDEANRIVVSDEILFEGNRTIHRYSTQIRGTDDRYYGRFYIFEEVTDAKLAEDELINARNEADAANRAKSEFLSRMSHELRTPLNSILGFAQLLEMGELTAGQKKSVGHINKSGRHLLSLINDVLDISRIESGKVTMSIEPVAVSDVLEEVSDLIRPFVVDPHIKVSVDEVPADCRFVLADKQSLKQVLLNLLNNAVKYNQPGGNIRVAVTHAENSAKRQMTRISITDTGIGISPDKIPILFTPFERIGADRSGIEGTGLGLAVVKKLTELMHGRVGIESVVGVGSTFWVEFEKTENVLNELIVNAAEVKSVSETDHRKARLFYVEDNDSNIELVRQILAVSRPDVELLCSLDGQSLVAKVLDFKPDLILLDLNLPDISGAELLDRLMANELTAGIPVVILSANAMQKQIDLMLKNGARHYLTKPLDVSVFLETLDEFML